MNRECVRLLVLLVAELRETGILRRDSSPESKEITALAQTMSESIRFKQLNERGEPATQDYHTTSRGEAALERAGED